MKTKTILTFFLIAITACSNQELNSKIDRNVAAEKSVKSGAPMSDAIVDIINESDALTPVQKEKILALQKRMSAYLLPKQEEMRKLKLTFIRAILDPQTKTKEVSLLRRRIIDLNHQKMSRVLQGMEDAKEILGLTTINDERIYRAFVFDYDRPYN